MGQSKGGARRFGLPSVGLEVAGEAMLLAIDKRLMPLRRNQMSQEAYPGDTGLCPYMSKPEVRPEPVLAPRRDDRSAPDWRNTNFYGAVVHDEGMFRMWYYAQPFPNLEGDPPIPKPNSVCYAESDDGIEWRRPELGQVDYNGSLKNNAIALPGDMIEGVNVIKDEDDPDPARRYKMIYNPFIRTERSGGKGAFTLRGAVSPDGIRWKPSPGAVVPAWIEQAGFFKHNGLYLIHGQALEFGEGGGQRGRQGYAWISTDFDHWLDETAEAFTLSEPQDAADRGLTKPYDQVHLGVGAASFGNGGVGNGGPVKSAFSGESDAAERFSDTVADP